MAERLGQTSRLTRAPSRGGLRCPLDEAPARVDTRARRTVFTVFPEI